jgi:hypothetical protein
LKTKTFQKRQPVGLPVPAGKKKAVVEKTGEISLQSGAVWNLELRYKRPGAQEIYLKE